MPGEVLVDTSIFIDFFRGRSIADFEELVRQNRVRLSNIAHLEILQGVRSSEVAKIEFVLSGLKPVGRCPEVFELAEEILLAVKEKGLTLGVADLLIAAEALSLQIPIWSRDKIFSHLERLGLVTCFHPSTSKVKVKT